MRGKFQSEINKITNRENNLHKVNKGNKYENTMKNMSKYISDTKTELKKISNQNMNKSNNKLDVGNVADVILGLLKI